jgi:hypothetical protein
VHLAAEGGSLELLRWLVDGLGCPLYDEEEQPLRTQPRGDSVLGVASRRRHAHVMRWLVGAKECKVAEIADKAQLVAAVEFLLLGEESGISSSSDGDGAGGGGPWRRRRGLLPAAREQEEEVKQQEVSDYGSGEDDEEEAEHVQRLRQGHGLSTRRATATATATAVGIVSKDDRGGNSGSSGRRRSGGKKSDGKHQHYHGMPEGARCVDECLLCGVSKGVMLGRVAATDSYS